MGPLIIEGHTTTGWENMTKRIVIAITGATGVIYGYRTLLATNGLADLETHLIVSESAAKILRIEAGIDLEVVRKLATYSYDEHDFTASISSGSFQTSGMLIAPCSMKTLSAISTGFEQNLVVRAAMVTLKERRPLILFTRETPLGLIPLRNMVQVTEAGGTIMPPLPPLYFGMNDLTTLVDLTVSRALNLVGVKTKLLKEWGVEDKD